MPHHKAHTYQYESYKIIYDYLCVTPLSVTVSVPLHYFMVMGKELKKCNRLVEHHF